MIDPSTDQVSFGNFVLDLPRGELLRNGEPVPLAIPVFAGVYGVI
jgi:DNA-binding winged helix-turn-helix (wHTH) protein